MYSFVPIQGTQGKKSKRLADSPGMPDRADHCFMSTASLCLQLQQHIYQFLKSAYSRMESSGIPSEFFESEILIQRNRGRVFRDDIQLQLYISCVSGTLNTGLCKCFSEAKSPIFFQNADTEFCAVFHLVLCSDRLNPGQTGDLSVNKCKDLDFIRAFRLS